MINVADLLDRAEDAALTNRLFPGWWGDTSEGDEYMAEYSAETTDAKGVGFVIFWMFPQTKKSESEDSDLPWDNTEYIDRIERRDAPGFS